MSEAKPTRMPSARHRHWKSLEELPSEGDPKDRRGEEFPPGASEWIEELDRRRFLQLASASLALAGLTACTRQPLEKIVPYVRQPEEIVPGRPMYFATAATLGGYATGLLVESHEGRPTKIEGNPEHPASLGATDVFSQASLLDLYDPDRSQVVTHLGAIQTWSALVKALQGPLTAQRALGGEGLRILTRSTTSPTLARQMAALVETFPKAAWHQYEPVNRDNARAGAQLAFGEAVETRHDLTKADAILSLDADFLASGPGAVRYARQFAGRRRVREGQDSSRSMNRLYVIESAPSCTGALADHRLPLAGGGIPQAARALAALLGVPGATSDGIALEAGIERWLRAAAADLAGRNGRALVVAGDCQPPVVHALAHAMNEHLGAVGMCVEYTQPVEAQPVDQLASLARLVADMNEGRVEVLAILGGNPVYDAPADLRFREALVKVPLRVHLGLERDETSEYCQWHVPEAHYLEAWSDARAQDGTAGIVQPLIEPLYDGKSAHELLSALLDETPRDGYEIVRETWKESARSGDFEAFWRRSLHDGVVEGTRYPPRPVSLRPDAARRAAEAIAAEEPQRGGGGEVELLLRPDPTVHDGRFANNGWLQELPKPLTTLTWDNALLVSPATAAALGLESEDVVEIDAGEPRLLAAVLVLPGHVDHSATLHLGYGRRSAGRVGAGKGFDAYALRTSDGLWRIPSVTLRRVAAKHELARTQGHFSMEGRHLVRAGTIEEYRQDPGFAHKVEPSHKELPNMFPGFAYEGHSWGLAVDLGACTGCGACVIACQAENNIPVVGKEQVLAGREMHWLRIDRYFEGSAEDPGIHHQPVMCMHCEQAPCEVVCPVGATTHSSEGLNEMVYNRCVGTRYCSNNCPYKVRRFNFLRYNDDTTPVLKLLRNPDVTVRSRGVMEKCTYCVQRINGARIQAEKENRPIRDGEVVTACQQACPAQAIQFGDINDPRSKVSQWKAEPTNYGLLEPLNTRPRTSYLAKLRNPNPDLERS